MLLYQFRKKPIIKNKRSDLNIKYYCRETKFYSCDVLDERTI